MGFLPSIRWCSALLTPLLCIASARPSSAASCTVPTDAACPTIQAALNQASPGDTVSVNSGVYSEKISFPSGGTAGNPMTLRASTGHHPVMDGTGVAGSNIILIDGTSTAKNYVIVQGFELRNNLGVNDGSGVRILGSGTGIEIRDNEIHNVTGDHAMGITVYATNPAAIANLVIDGNFIHDCEPAQSEALTLNGNVDGFEITNNVVRDVNSIGIDCIGGETDIQPNPALVCRNGLIRGNTVIRANADYDGGFAGGIYVDGGNSITIENNVVTESDLGIEIAAENAGLVTDEVRVRNNVLYRNEKAGLVFGGFAASVGRANSNEFRGNTLFENNTVGPNGQGRFFSGNGVAEIWVQFGSDNILENNIVYAGPANVFVGSFDLGSSIDNTFDYNLFYSAAGVASGEFSLNGVAYPGFAAWQAGAGQDAASIAANPLFVNPSAGDFHIAISSPAVNAGNPAFSPDVSETDLDGQPRKIGAAVDIGADEGTCGNGGIPDPGEACDDGNTSNCDGCDNDCTLSSACGNGVTCSGFGEACDDGNVIDGDCCSSSCNFEAAGGSCSDHDACTTADACDGAGSCSGDAIGGPACALDNELRKCQEAIAKSGRRYFETLLKGLQTCRNNLNKGKAVYSDQAQTQPIAGPNDCDQEYRAASRAAKAAFKARDAIVARCNDILVAQLGACAASIDGLVDVTATAGCLLTTHVVATAALIDDEYGGGLAGNEPQYADLRMCQEQTAKAGRAFATTRVKQIHSCRNKLNRGQLLFFDVDKTQPLVNPADCPDEFKAAVRIGNAGTKARNSLVAHCTDSLLSGLGGVCGTTVDAVVDAAGSGGCLIDGHRMQTDAVLDAEY
jgi:cysteine-rich repeat protein